MEEKGDALRSIPRSKSRFAAYSSRCDMPCSSAAGPQNRGLSPITRLGLSPITLALQIEAFVA